MSLSTRKHTTKKKKNYIQEMGERLEELFTIGANGKEETEDSSERQGNESSNDQFNLQRFVAAQEQSYSRALEEIRNGHKKTHWMWFILPQIAGSAHSSMAQKYAISCRSEAEAYLRHPVLGMRLLEITEELLQHEGLTALDIFGSPDDLKLRSCMTLFSSISEEGNIFERVLVKYFNGQPCQFTLAAVAKK